MESGVMSVDFYLAFRYCGEELEYTQQITSGVVGKDALSEENMSSQLVKNT
jgi:hypothetical protein